MSLEDRLERILENLDPDREFRWARSKNFAYLLVH